MAPPANHESAASAVNVNVKTVVVRSGTARRRTVALRIPIATAVSTITGARAATDACKAETSGRKRSCAHEIRLRDGKGEQPLVTRSTA